MKVLAPVHDAHMKCLYYNNDPYTNTNPSHTKYLKISILKDTNIETFFCLSFLLDSVRCGVL